MGGLMDKAKDAVGNKGDRDKAGGGIGDQAIEKGGDMVDDRTDNKYVDQVDKGQDMARERHGGGEDTTPTEGEKA